MRHPIMKQLLGLVLALLVFAGFQNNAVGQRRRFDPGMGGPAPERLDKFRKMRLVEVLKLNEDDAVRFFVKQNLHEETQRGLMKSRNDLLDDIEDVVKDNEEKGEVQKLTDQVLSVDQKIFNERQRYQEEIRKLLSPEQFAKFLLFERNFGRQVKDALEEMRQERHPNNR